MISWRFALALSGLALLCSSAVHAQTSEPQTFVVSRGEPRGGNGSPERPFGLVEDALEAVVAGRGDTVLVRAGFDRERVILPPNTTLKAETGPSDTQFEGNPAAQENLFVLTEGCVLEGFAVGNTGGNAVAVFENQTAEVRNCIIHNAERGIAVANGARLRAYNNTFIGNEVAVFVDGTGALEDARNNIFVTDTVAIFLSEGAESATAFNCFSGPGLPVAGGAPGADDFASDPGLASPRYWSHHLKADSSIRDRGDPAAAFNDVDGTRNDPGVDGGPYAFQDDLAPFVALQFLSPQGDDKVRRDFNTSGSLDLFGIRSYRWDFDLSDGLDFSDAEGREVSHDFPGLGRFVGGVQVEDERGLVTQRLFDVVVGSALPASILASRQAGPAPLTTNLGALTSGSVLEAQWDFNLDGRADAEGFTTSRTLDAANAPGSYPVGLLLEGTPAAGNAQAALPITLTEHRLIAAQLFQPADADPILTVTSGGVLGGATLDFGAGVNAAVVAAAAEPAEDDFPLLPPGELVGLIEFGPANTDWSARPVASVPLSAQPAEGAAASVYRWNAETQGWDTDGIYGVRIVDGPVARVRFETGALGTFAIAVDAVDESGPSGGGCHAAEKTSTANMAGDYGLLAALLLTLMALGLRPKKAC